MVIFFTDFGWQGPYIGQMHMAVAEYASSMPLIDLMHDAPKHDPRAAAYLLAALARTMPEECCCVGVVDPGVGTERDPIILQAGSRFFIGPDNGLFAIAARQIGGQSGDARWHRITWRPPTLSASFHGRDLFAPVAAMIAAHRSGTAGRQSPLPAGLTEEIDGPAIDPPWPDDVDEVIYIDGFGNCILGRRADGLGPAARIDAGGGSFSHAATFGDVGEGAGFWYANSMGLVEIAVNKGSAADCFNLRLGMPVTIA